MKHVTFVRRRLQFRSYFVAAVILPSSITTRTASTSYSHAITAL